MREGRKGTDKRDGTKRETDKDTKTPVDASEKRTEYEVGIAIVLPVT